MKLKPLPYHYEEAKDLVLEEIDAEKLDHNLKEAETYKRRKLLAGEIIKLAFEWKFYGFV